LAGCIGKETYVGTPFPGTGPIDVLYVAGLSISRFTLAGTGTRAYGSDHLPVSTTFTVSGMPPLPGITIASLLPNFEGADAEHE
jgi:hypothetical protein